MRTSPSDFISPSITVPAPIMFTDGLSGALGFAMEFDFKLNIVRHLNYKAKIAKFHGVTISPEYLKNRYSQAVFTPAPA